MATTPRPTPIFADRLLEQDRRPGEEMYGKAKWGEVMQAVRSAQKFVLTEDALDRILDAMNSFPEQLVYNAKFARPPHDIMWLEVANGADAVESVAEGAYNTFYLIKNGSVHVILRNVDSSGRESFILNLWTVDLNTPSTHEDRQSVMRTFGFTTEQFNRAFWGRRLWDEIPDALRGRMAQQHRVRMIPTVNGAGADPEEFAGVRESLDMHIRVVVATLLALNQPKSVLNITSKDAQRRLTGKGMKRYFAHNVVTINLGAKNRIRFNYRQPGGEHASPRWHEVMGHYVHDRTARTASCTHGFGLPKDWWVRMDTEDGRERWECSGCGGKRTWRTYPEGRGDASKGMSLHHHVVQG
jgi:hypothetical protein